MAEGNNGQKLEIYHERQRLQMCAIHAINNLFQGAHILCREEMNDVCKELNPSSWFNPHMSMFGIGNYDINAIMAVLSKRGYEVIWFDKRRSPDAINVSKVYGMLINSTGKLDAFGYKFSFNRFRHWFSVKMINDVYYNLDSKLKEPQKIGSDSELRSYLKERLQESKTELLLVVDKEIAETRGWDNQATSQRGE